MACSALSHASYHCSLLTARHRKCDEGKPHCNNCLSTNRPCEGYKMRLLFDTDSLVLKEKAVLKKRTKSFTHHDAFVRGGNQMMMNSTPMIRAVTLLESQESSLELSSHSMSSTNSVNESVLESSGQTQKFPVNVQNQPTNRERLKLEMDSGMEAKSPLSQAFGDLFLAHRNAERLANMPLDTALSDIFATPHETDTPESTNSQSFTNFDAELLQLIGKTHVFDDSLTSPPANASLVMSHQEENRMLKHFFKDLLPLLDAHPKSPWPALALQYCDFDVARSCFISLACIHIYESRKGGNEYYDKGMAHIHSTMTHLIDSISSSTPSSDSPESISEASNKMRIQSFVILVLMNVHILFAVLEKGKSSLSRYLFKVFGSVCQNNDFYRSLMKNESKGSLVVVLSWYDTVSAMVSPDCRLPYCSPDWYGSYQDVISTLKMMGCPGEIFRALSEVCFLRHEIHNGTITDDEDFEAEIDTMKRQLLDYRDYIDFKDGEDYSLRLKGAQCWSLAVYISLLRLFRTEQRRVAIRAAVNEFIDVYGSMPSESPIVTQMVWPVYAIGCECTTAFERNKLLQFMDTLYETAQMGTLASLGWVVRQVWQRGVSQEKVLSEWLEEGVDYLPL
ncbi:hypothetical protein METBIDRAFT_144839 [Metschnikowia bicuspidata var. bicuspidata NRRL YB-4993]|uniref:Zn(2)-C6 fungal-type domain-containing protein n=1 Tax=Metschnikowia bicuspidata var. bicuspidata NRRL YB-4993 TaxID=869754 RepID=A0A1A0HD51_9ASCO|nr:hypothetical protein METBIDRAFT_144839 [Metschnikowia bicuspidata var. bicuspidata NRRL YB-4993]OBA22009.1 hypothetical protein METBIDRAFT_144839 [Metschnikowia bicuspidata var. bicuspidata NRRL YB-4993]